MIKAYTGIKASMITLFVIGGLILFVSILFWGMARAIQLLLPLLIVFSYFLIIVFLAGILPATFLKHLRPKLYVYSILMSYMLGAATWMVSFFVVIKFLG